MFFTTCLCEVARHHLGEWRLQCLKEAARIFSCYDQTSHKLVARVEEIKRKVADMIVSSDITSQIQATLTEMKFSRVLWIKEALSYMWMNQKSLV